MRPIHGNAKHALDPNLTQTHLHGNMAVYYIWMRVCVCVVAIFRCNVNELVSLIYGCECD